MPEHNAIFRPYTLTPLNTTSATQMWRLHGLANSFGANPPPLSASQAIVCSNIFEETNRPFFDSFSGKTRIPLTEMILDQLAVIGRNPANRPGPPPILGNPMFSSFPRSRNTFLLLFLVRMTCINYLLN